MKMSHNISPTTKMLAARASSLEIYGIGEAISNELPDEELGHCMYRYTNAGLTLELYEFGIACGDALAPSRLRYDSILEVIPAHLREVMMGKRNPDQIIPMTVITSSGSTQLRMDMRMYTHIYPLLAKLLPISGV